MDRLQSRCVVASVSLHGLLAAVLIFGPAFLVPSPKTVNADVLTVIPATLVDAQISNAGGNPRVTQPPRPAPLVQPQPQPQPQPTAPTPPPPRPETVTPKEPAPKSSSDEPDFTKPAVKKQGPNVNKQVTTRKANPRSKASDSAADSNAEERAQAKLVADAKRRAAAALSGAIASVGNVASSSVAVDISPGPGGQAFASYDSVVKTIYTQAWIEPAGVDDDQATTKASVTIAKDGTVISAKIVGLSGNAAVDASVRRTLERVTFVAPFPAGAKEDQRTFTISFNLKAKRQLG